MKVNRQKQAAARYHPICSSRTILSIKFMLIVSPCESQPTVWRRISRVTAATDLVTSYRSAESAARRLAEAILDGMVRRRRRLVGVRWMAEYMPLDG